MRRNILLLALSQAMMIVGTSLLISTSALVGLSLAPQPSLATVPLGLQFLAMMLSTFPASFLMKHHGRRVGFMTGALIGVVGAVLSSYALFAGQFWLFCLGGMLLGIFHGFGQFYRFAAADVANADYRSRAISWVLAGGILAAFIGPNLARFTREAFSVPFAGSYLALIGVYLLSLTLSTLLTIPPPGAEERAKGGRSLAQIAAQPAFIVAALGGMIGYGVMNLIMTSTPLAMAAVAHPFESAALVIQWHIVGMFLPSFFTGHLIKRFGVLNIMAAGALLLSACVAVNFSGTGLWQFWLALVLLGLGWNFLYIGATTLLTETYRPEEKAKTQALNDCLVFATVTLTAFSAGALQHRFGWQAVNTGVLPFIAMTLLATLWLRLRLRVRRTAVA